MQNQFTKKQKLLNEAGCLNEAGFAYKPLLEYNRSEIAASKWRIKEWDYYAILNPEYGVALTVADLGYTGMVTLVFFDFKNPFVQMKTKLVWFPFGAFKMPSSSKEGNVSFSSDELKVEFIKEKGKRFLKGYAKAFFNENDLTIDLELTEANDDTMVIATPWKENKKAFYYNQKINCMPSSGSVSLGNQTYPFLKDSSYAVLDWGRGVWTYKNTWYWSSLSANVNGKRVGFNLGYGFGDTSNATENMIFVDGKATKLDQVTFELNHKNHMEPWTFKDNEGKLNLTMTPILDRMDNTNFVIIKNFGHQVFGHFNGTIKLEEETIELKNVLGFAEEITNHY